MNGNNTQTEEGFIKALAHPRKVELAEMIFAEAEVEAMNEAGYDRISILEMARSIRTSVEGMEELDIDIPRTEESKSRKTIAAEEANMPSEGGEGEEAANPETPNTPEAANAGEGDVQTGQDQTAPTTDAPVTPEAEVANTVVDENAANDNVPPAPQG